MSEPQFFDDGLQAMFEHAAAQTPDDGFTDALFARMQRRGRVRFVTLAGAGLLGAVVAVSQFGDLVELYASRARALAGLIPSAAISDAAHVAAISGGAGQGATIIAVIGAFGLLAASGAMALGRR